MPRWPTNAEYDRAIAHVKTAYPDYILYLIDVDYRTGAINYTASDDKGNTIVGVVSDTGENKDESTR